MSEEIGPEEEIEEHENEEEERENDDDGAKIAEQFLIDTPEEDGRIGGLVHEKYIDIDWPQINENGEEVVMRISVPVIHEKKKREFKTVTRKRIVEIPQYDLPEEGEEGGDEFVVKEDVIESYDKTVVLETITRTVLIRTQNKEGEIVEIEHDVVEEFIISEDPTKFKVIVVKKVLSDGEEILEEHITPEMSVKEPYEGAIESSEVFEEEGEGIEEEFSTSDELRALAELEEAELEEEEEEEDMDISFAELEEEEDSDRHKIKEMGKMRTVQEDDEDEFGEYIDEEIKQAEESHIDEVAEEFGKSDTEEEEESEEDKDKVEEEEFLIAKFPIDYDYKDEKDEEISSSLEKIDIESSIESEEKSMEEEVDEDIGKTEKVIEPTDMKSSKIEELGSEEMMGEEITDLKGDILEDEKCTKEEEPATEECNKYWWRTSGYDLDDFDLPEDPVKANKILLTELWRQLKLNDKYVNGIRNYYRKHKDEISYFPPYLEVEELHKCYLEELKELKQILDTFSDSYDDFNYKMTLVRKRNKKSDKLLDFLMEALKKTLIDLAKKTDRKALTRYTKGKTLEQMISEIFRLEDKLSFAYIRKAIYTLEIEEMKYMIYGGNKTQSNIPLDGRAVDLLLLASMQSKCHHSAELQDLQEFKIKKLKEAFGLAMEDYCFKVHESSYNSVLKELNLKRLDNKLKKIHTNRQKRLKNLLKTAEFRKKSRKRNITQEQLQKVHEYLISK